MILKHMSPEFHEALQLLFQSLSITGITPPSWLNSRTILFYKKGEPTTLDNYRPITLANSPCKLWTTCIVMLATDYIESRKILSLDHEGFKVDRSCARAITHLGICVEDAITYHKDIVLCYLDFKGAFPSADQDTMVRTLFFFGLPEDCINIINKLYSGATIEFVTTHGHTSPIGIRWGTLQGDPLSPPLFDLMIEPLIRWLTIFQKGYDITSCGLQLAGKWCADDGRLMASAARSWSGWTGTARGRCQMPFHLVVGDGNSRDPGPARLRQEAKRGARWLMQPIGEEIVHCSNHNRCSRKHRPV
jgi:hypothetical protein